MAEFTDIGLAIARINMLEAEVRRLRDGIATHRGAHAGWADRRDGWEEATFAADYNLWSLLDDD